MLRTICQKETTTIYVVQMPYDLSLRYSTKINYPEFLASEIHYLKCTLLEVVTQNTPHTFGLTSCKEISLWRSNSIPLRSAHFFQHQWGTIMCILNYNGLCWLICSFPLMAWWPKDHFTRGTILECHCHELLLSPRIPECQGVNSHSTG